MFAKRSGNPITDSAKIRICRTLSCCIFFYAATDKFPAWYFGLFIHTLVWKIKLKGAALLLSAIHSDKPAVFLHYLVRYRQPQACSYACFLC